MTDHGGNIYEAARRMGVPESEIIDFSALINPMGEPSRTSVPSRRAGSGTTMPAASHRC